VSLIRLLKSLEGKQLIAYIGNLKPLIKITSQQGLTWGASPLIKPTRNEVWYAALVGIAWDYWIRLWLLRCHKGSEGTLIAEEVLLHYPIKFIDSDRRLEVSLYHWDEQYNEEVRSYLDPVEVSIAKQAKVDVENVKARRQSVING